MRRRALWVVSASALVGALTACNGILGIDAPNLVEAGDDAKAADGGPHDATASDARRDGTTNDATTSDGGRDATADATSDGRGDAGRDVSAPSDARIFDGNCTCEGDACAPIVVVTPLPGHVGGLAAGPAGLFYSDDINEPTYGIVALAPFGGSGPTTLEPDAALPQAVAVHGADVYWIDGIAGLIGTCNASHCNPRAFIAGDPLPSSSSLGVTGAAVVWSDSVGIHTCPFSGCSDGGAETTLPRSKNGVFALNDAGVFWTAKQDGGAPVIFGCGAAGCSDAGAPLVATDAAVADLGASGQDLYWLTGTTLWTCPLSNSGADCAGEAHALVPFVTASPPGGMLVDPTGIYWRDSTTSNVTRAPLDGGPPEVFASAAQGGALALSATCVFWSDKDLDAGQLKALAK